MHPLNIIVFSERQIRLLASIDKDDLCFNLDARGNLLDVPSFLLYSSPVLYYNLVLKG